MITILERHWKISATHFIILHDCPCYAHSMGTCEVFQNTQNL